LDSDPFWQALFYRDFPKEQIPESHKLDDESSWKKNYQDFHSRLYWFPQYVDSDNVYVFSNNNTKIFREDPNGRGWCPKVLFDFFLVPFSFLAPSFCSHSFIV